MTAILVLADTNQRVAALISLLESTRRNAIAAMASRAAVARITGTAAGLSESDEFAIAASSTIDISDGSLVASMVSSGTMTVKEFLDGVNGVRGLKVAASLTPRGALQLEAAGCNAIEIGGSVAPSELAQLGLRAVSVPAEPPSEVRSACARQLDSVASQIDRLVSDACANGVNLLDRGSLTVRFGDSVLNCLRVVGVDFTCPGLGIAAPVSGFQTDGDIRRVLTSIDIALSSLQTQSMIFAADADVLRTRLDFMRGIRAVARFSQEMIPAVREDVSARS